MHLFDWDEINFAECAREMIVTGDYLNVQINFRPFWEKPPLFIWLQVISMKVFGINEFAARLPNAVCGIVTLLVLYQIGRKFHSARFGIWWAFVYAASILPHLYFRSGIIDPWFNLFIFLSVYFFAILTMPDKKESRKARSAALSGFFIGLAVLTKGPAAYLILGLVIAVFYLPHLWFFFFKSSEQRRVTLSPKNIGLFSLVAVLTGGFWFLLQVISGHGDMVLKFILYQVRLFTIPDAGHGGHWSYHIWVLLTGVFPASVFALRSLKRNTGDSSSLRHFHLLMLILFWVVLILFSIVTTKIIHYSSLCYFPITFMAVQAIIRLLDGRVKWQRGWSLVLIILTLVISLVVIGLPVGLIYKEKIIASGIIKDAFTVACLQADVRWTGLEGLTGLFLLTGISVSVFLMKKRIHRALILLFATSLIFTWSVILIFPYRIEQYTQGAVIEFYKTRAKEDCYIMNSGYFSYAPLYYSDKMPEDLRRPMWLLTGDIDKPFYLVLKEPHYIEWKHIIPAMKVLYRKNGFVFLQRTDAPVPLLSYP